MRIEKKATLISTIVAFLLVTFKLTVGIISGSVAVLASAIDSLLDMVVSLFNYFALHNSDKEPDENFNFGRRKLEPLAAVIEGTIISLSALFILYTAISKMVQGSVIEHLDLSVGVMVASLVITAGLVFFLNHVANKTGNMVIAADALHYKTDLLSNGAVLISLVFISFTEYTFIDPLLGIGISIYMIYSAFPLIKEGILMLLDAALDSDSVAKITKLLNSQLDINSYHDLRTRRSGSDIYLSVHIVFSISTSLYDAHMVGDRIELGLKNLFPENNVYALIHLDPYDDSEEEHLS
ncbi:MAG: cation transporter [Sulfuricurvum sp. GWF2_44_89]|uniref:Cation-efflux pump n=1 Tax=Sulfuricurvum kujiense TaxID=148813 RepID=A0A2D3WC76_9BACT|nr:MULTISPECIES: cation diffusion facilitator family transporter [Sulfuricurvum]OHD78994.1 MAG: cation transporter [Sulfuricurvum sp. GWF2_44_89]OHD93604.1 MAG: cation transporter [Sulfuricurvum sp. RIFOXYD12_FULL_44_77]OHD97817.1 MAG: cation transporter [Sulfuricurvum sp. RIFOXYD2_FULL_44_160]DAB38912.1 MAG TPA: cation-efflux pump [Sulfuricurvum kujiense]